MCCHKFYIYSTCGHSLFSLHPIIPCPSLHSTQPCTPTSHPYQSWNLPSLCPTCQTQRTSLLTQVEASQKIQFNEWRWKVSYGMPAHGKDFWGQKADERAQLEKETGRRKRRSLPFRWKRTWKSRRGQVEIVANEPVRCAPALLDRRGR